MLLVMRYRRTFDEDIEAACFHWFRILDAFPGTNTQADFESSMIVNGWLPLLSNYLPDSVRIDYNYYIQSGGKKYSNAVHYAYSLNVLTNILPSGGTCCFRKYGTTRKDQYLGRFSLPFVPAGYYSTGSRWTAVADGIWNVLELNYPLGFNINGGIRFRPVVYSPANDTFTTITAIRRMRFPTRVRRRRIRARKAGHTVEAPLNWGTVGHW